MSLVLASALAALAVAMLYGALYGLRSPTPIAEKGADGDAFFSDLALDTYIRGVNRLTMKATSAECRELIESEYLKYVSALADETALPFEDVMFYSQCVGAKPPLMYPFLWSSLPNRTDEWPAPPPRLQSESLDPHTLSICYVLLVHDEAEFVERLINALIEPQHTFVVHVDLKAQSVFIRLHSFVALHMLNNVFLVDNGRVAANWGGYSIVNATLASMGVAWSTGRHFDFLIDMSGATYPLRSNRLIRETLSMRGGNKIYMLAMTTPTNTAGSPDFWNHFVECDDSLHRIARLAYPRGINLYTGSQWFVLPRHVVQWFLFDPLPFQFAQYAKHIMVADENYFSTLAMNSPYCADMVTTTNFVFLLFDKWEHENKTLADGRKVFNPDVRKCVNPNPQVCGRSPTTLTTEYRNLLQMSKMLFARKFNPRDSESMAMVAEIDTWRKQDDEVNTRGVRRSAAGVYEEESEVMIRQRYPAPAPQTPYERGLTDGNTIDYCFELVAGANLRMRPCNASEPQQWLTVGPCTGSGFAKQEFEDGRCAVPMEGENDVFCQIRAPNPVVGVVDKVSATVASKEEPRAKSTCLDISGENPHFGGALIGWECAGQWNQLFRLLPDCSVSAVQPRIVGRVRGLEDRGDMLLCLESKEDSVSKDVFVLTAPCYNASSTESRRPLGQIFEVVTRKGTAFRKYSPVEAKNIEADVEVIAEAGCAFGDETCGWADMGEA